VLRWPLAEALLALEAHRQREDLEMFRFEELMYSIGGRKKKPTLPRSLEPRDRPDRPA
jgi:hypothetical protein